MNVICPYCDQPAELVDGLAIYPHRPDLRGLKFWRCIPCAAHVGCHRSGDGSTPLGRLATKELRLAKNAAHRAFDPIWQSGRMKRRPAYQWLAQQLGIDIDECHIGMFDLQQCQRVATICAKEPT